MRTGYIDGKYYISASMLAQFVYDKQQVLDRWYRRNRKSKTKPMKQGNAWHGKLGYNNRKEYNRELILNDNTVVLFGVPDYCAGCLEELKTIGGKHVPKRKLDYARVQLLVYLHLLDLDIGRLVFVSRKTGDVVYCEDVKRDDEKLKKIINEFIHWVSVNY